MHAQALDEIELQRRRCDATQRAPQLRKKRRHIFSAGAQGVVSKADQAGDLLKAVLLATRGKRYASPGFAVRAEGNDFDEGSTCVTQVQGLRACRNAGSACVTCS